MNLHTLKSNPTAAASAQRQLEDGLELSTICRQLELKAPDGKMRETDCANVDKNARHGQESKTGKSVVTGENYLPPNPEKKKLK